MLSPDVTRNGAPTDQTLAARTVVLPVIVQRGGALLLSGRFQAHQTLERARAMPMAQAGQRDAQDFRAQSAYTPPFHEGPRFRHVAR